VQCAALAVLLLPLRRFLRAPTDGSTPERVGGVVVPDTKLEDAEYGSHVLCAALLVLLCPLGYCLQDPCAGDGFDVLPTTPDDAEYGTSVRSKGS